MDGVTLAAVQAYGVHRMLDELHQAFRAGVYHPVPVRRVEIPKADGTKRPLGIPAVVDRVCQQAAKIVLEPLFEADFLPCSFGSRPKRSPTDALERIRVGYPKGECFVFEADIKDFFGPLDQDKLLDLVKERVSDRRVIKLLQQWLRVGVMVDGVVTETVTGTPQGGVISPLLANIYLRAFGLSLHPDKTRVIDLREGKEGFDFLGCHLHARMSGRLWEQHRIIRYHLHRWPSQRSMKRARARVKALNGRSQVGMELKEVIGRLNLFLRGWGNFFRTGKASDKFRQLDRYVRWRLFRLLVKRRGRNLHAGQADRLTETWFHDQGLHKLLGTVRYPKAA